MLGQALLFIALPSVGLWLKDLGQQGWIDVASGEYRDNWLVRGRGDAKFRRVTVERGRDGGRAARFGDQPGLPGEAADGVEHLVLGHRDDVVDVRLDVREGQLADLLDAERVGPRARGLRGRPGHAGARAQRVAGVGGQFRFDPDDPRPRQQGLDRDGDARDESAAADRDEDGGRRPRFGSGGEILGDLQADRALPGDHVPVIERRDRVVAPDPGDLFGGRDPGGERWLDADEFGPGRLDRVGLDRGRVLRDDDRGADAEQPRRVRDRESVIAA